MKKTLISTISVMLALNACTAQEPNNTASAPADVQTCAHPLLQNAVQQELVQQFKQHATIMSQNPLLDTEKLQQINALVKVYISDGNMVNQSCQAQLNIEIPNEIIGLAEKNAPLLQAESPAEIMRANTHNGNIRYDGKSIVLPLNYAPLKERDTIVFQPSDENLNSATRLIMQSLAPYGVKDMVQWHGKMMTRQEALQQLTAPKTPKPSNNTTNQSIENIKEVEPITTVEPTPEIVPETPKIAPEASPEPAPIPETIQPEQPQKNIKEHELNQATKDNQAANQNIKAAWRNISPDIQQSLVDEQRAWENQKRQSCRHAGSKGRNAAEMQYLQTQCDTRITRERIKYLQGFSIE